MCSIGSDWQYVIIGSDNDMETNRRQAIVWTNDDLVFWRMYASRGFNGLNASTVLIWFTTVVYLHKRTSIS